MYFTKISSNWNYLIKIAYLNKSEKIIMNLIWRFKQWKIQNLDVNLFNFHFIYLTFYKFATVSVEYSINKIIDRQIDGISMGSLLGPTITNMFVGFYEQDLLVCTENPISYSWYADGTMCLIVRLRLGY